MKATISTTMPTSIPYMWDELQKINSLMQVASPLLTFKPQNGQALPETWEAGKTYALELAAFNVLPLGKHTIEVKKIDANGA